MNFDRLAFDYGELRGKYERLKTEIKRLRAEKTQHDGDCTIYAALCNGCPTDGICTCGFGWQRVREGDFGHNYSKERRATFPVPCDAEVEAMDEYLTKVFGGSKKLAEELLVDAKETLES